MSWASPSTRKGRRIRITTINSFQSAYCVPGREDAAVKQEEKNPYLRLLVIV
jgi:hypothetical protein